MRYTLALLAIAACHGGNSNETPDASVGIDAAPDSGGFSEAPHDDAPQSVSVGGPVTAAPVVVPIFFANDATMQTKIEGFLTALAGSSYWTATTSEYGIGALTVHATIVATDAAPPTDAALQTWLATQLDGTHAGWPAPDGNTIYAVFLPTSTFSSSFGTACQDYGGYHDEGMAGANKYIYALLPRCGSSSDGLTITTSHELVEAASDPFPFTNGAYQLVDAPHFVWAMMPGGELGDMCEYVANASQRLVGSYAVQRTWSNASAKAGHDPCVPAMPDPYMSAAPVLTEDVMIDPQDGTPLVPTKGVQVAMGASKTIEVDLFSDAPTTADWTVKAIDAGQLGGTAPELTLSLDTATGHNGDKLHLTITRTANGANGGSELVLSSRVNNHSVSLWWGYVAN